MADYKIVIRERVSFYLRLAGASTKILAAYLFSIVADLVELGSEKYEINAHEYAKIG